MEAGNSEWSLVTQFGGCEHRVEPCILLKAGKSQALLLDVPQYSLLPFCAMKY